MTSATDVPCRRDLGGALGCPPCRHLAPGDIYTDVICRQLCVAQKGRLSKERSTPPPGAGGMAGEGGVEWAGGEAAELREKTCDSQMKSPTLWPRASSPGISRIMGDGGAPPTLNPSPPTLSPLPRGCRSR